MGFCLLSSFLVLVLSISAIAQDLSVKAVKLKTISTQRIVRTVKVFDENGVELSSTPISGPESKPVESQSNVVLVETEAANVRVTAEDSNRNPVSVKKLGGGRYGLANNGTKTWVRVTAIDFKANIFDELTIVVEPVKPPKPDVDNKYGLGVVAATFAPMDAKTRKEVSSHYRQAADFLFGIPTLKAVQSQNENSTDSNVFVWLSNQAQLMQCPDQATCEQWAKFRSELAKAIVVSQKARQFTRQDWHSAFLEISKAVK